MEAPFDKSRIQKVIDAGLIPKLLEFMQKDDEPQLQVLNVESIDVNLIS